MRDLKKQFEITSERSITSASTLQGVNLTQHLMHLRLFINRCRGSPHQPMQMSVPAVFFLGQGNLICNLVCSRIRSEYKGEFHSLNSMTDQSDATHNPAVNDLRLPSPRTTSSQTLGKSQEKGRTSSGKTGLLSLNLAARNTCPQISVTLYSLCLLLGIIFGIVSIVRACKTSASGDLCLWTCLIHVSICLVLQFIPCTCRCSRLGQDLVILGHASNPFISGILTSSSFPACGKACPSLQSSANFQGM